ncbi:MAG: pilus assembly protein TadG-related protein, partial [Planctomycetaceae bacterium]
MAVILPILCGFVGLVVDSSMMMVEYRSLQHATDCAATAAAMALYRGDSAAVARNAAIECIRDRNGFASAIIDVNIPPISGPYAGQSSYAEVISSREIETYFIQVLGSESMQTVRTRSVAGRDDATAGGAVVVLDPDPPNVTVNTLGLMTVSVPPVQLGGLECLGLGQLKIDGALLVNSKWGGVDENGDPAGESAGLPWGVNCTPILPLTKVRARDIRVVGGVCDEDNNGHFVAGKASPLRCGKLPVPDPFADLPVP